MDNTRGHGPEEVFWDNLGEGFRIICLCGWVTCPDKFLTEVGQEFDDHLAHFKSMKANR